MKMEVFPIRVFVFYCSSQFYLDPTNTAKGYVGTPARYKTVTVKGQQVKLKWCATCQIWRPPRASHCGLCNNCYGKMDDIVQPKIFTGQNFYQGQLSFVLHIKSQK